MCALPLLIGCVDRATAPLSSLKRISSGPASVVESDGFYRDPADGLYFWDFTEPEGDAALPPTIGTVASFIQVPKPGTEGWVEATVYYSYADVARIILTADARGDTRILYSTAVSTSRNNPWRTIEWWL